MAIGREWGMGAAILTGAASLAGAHWMPVETAFPSTPTEREAILPINPPAPLAPAFDRSSLTAEEIVRAPAPVPAAPARREPTFAEAHRLLGTIIADGESRALVSHNGRTISVRTGDMLSQHLIAEIGEDHIVGRKDGKTVRLSIPPQREARR